jgi:orotate phosphoribosyltransferase-like protein
VEQLDKELDILFGTEMDNQRYTSLDTTEMDYELADYSANKRKMDYEAESSHGMRKRRMSDHDMKLPAAVKRNKFC